MSIEQISINTIVKLSQRVNEQEDEIAKLKEEKTRLCESIVSHKEAINNYVKDCMVLDIKNRKFKKGLEFIKDTAPYRYEYNEAELRMVMKARQCLKELEGEG